MKVTISTRRSDDEQRRAVGRASRSNMSVVDGMLDPQPSSVSRGDLRTLVESLESRIKDLEAQLAKKAQ